MEFAIVLRRAGLQKTVLVVQTVAGPQQIPGAVVCRHDPPAPVELNDAQPGGVKQLRKGRADSAGSYKSGTGTEDLVFGWTVPANIPDDGAGLVVPTNFQHHGLDTTRGLVLDGGTIKSTGGVAVNIRHGQYDTDSRVDTTAPVLTAGADGATVDGTALMLTFQDPDEGNSADHTAGADGATVDGTALMLTFQDPDEGNSADHLDEASAPADFAVTVAGSARTVSSVNVNGSTVTLTLASPVGHAHTVTAGYTPGTTKIRDRWGNEAAQIAGRSVRTDSPEPSLSIEPVTVDESDGTATFTLTLSGPSAESTTRPGTALRRRGRITQRRTAPSPLRREKRPSPSASRSPTTLSTRMARPFGNAQQRGERVHRSSGGGGNHHGR